MSVTASSGAAAPRNSGTNGATTSANGSTTQASLTTSTAQTPGVLKYGQTLRLLADSHYHPASSELEIGIGVYEKKGKHGILNAVPPLGDPQEHLFKEDEYKVLDPSGQHAEGTAVQFGHTLVLVNQDNLVWNNKTGGITGYIGPRARQTNGEMFVSFHPNPKGPAPKSLFIHFGDEIVIDVEDANRHVRTYNKRLTNFKKPTSSILGGYICCDGKGHDMVCTLVPPRFQIKKVFVRGKTLNSYQFGQPIDITNENSSLEVQFSHDKKMILPSDKLADMAYSGNIRHFVPLADGPGGVQMTLQVTVPESMSAVDSNASLSWTQKLANKLRAAPVHQVSILVVISSVILAILKRSGLVQQWIAVGLAACIWTPSMFLLLAGDKTPTQTSTTKPESKTGSRTLTLVQYVYHADAPFPDGDNDHHEKEIPPVTDRFIRATKGDKAAALVRWKDTLHWRKEEHIDTILSEPMPHFRTIKANYPHYYHKRGYKDEPVYYEKPGKINLKEMRTAGVTLDHLLRNSQMCTEFLWSVLEKDDNKRCISVLDVDGISFSDFGGEVVDYIRRCSGYTGKHYPERCAYIIVINVPGWFNMIWKVIQGMIDEATREKISIVRGKDKIYEALAARIPHENIPEEFGGGSTGSSPEEDILFQLQDYNNQVEGVTNPLVGEYAPRPYVLTENNGLRLRVSTAISNVLKPQDAETLEKHLSKIMKEEKTSILHQSIPHFHVIHSHYPRFYHKRGRNNEVVFYDQPGRLNMDALKAAGVTIEHLTQSFAFMTEYLWEVVVQSDETQCRSITVIDVHGMGCFSVNSDVIEYVRKISEYTRNHYPGRCGCIFIINVPSWFDLIWRMVHGIIEPGIRKKIVIVPQSSNILEALSTRIPIENILKEYGGLSEGESDEEKAMKALVDFNNNVPGSVNPLACQVD